jgi:hypothetical protein
MPEFYPAPAGLKLRTLQCAVLPKQGQPLQPAVRTVVALQRAAVQKAVMQKAVMQKAVIWKTVIWKAVIRKTVVQKTVM